MFDEIFDGLESKIAKRSGNNAALAKIYIELNDVARMVSAVKSTILQHVEENLRRDGLRWDECDVANFGITDPTPRAKVDEKAWEAALESSLELTKLENEYQSARTPFLVDATQDERPYIRKKRGA